ncbi:MAG: MFS transporter [Pseudomonadota bacterium]
MPDSPSAPAALSARHQGKTRAIALLAVAEILAMALWFSSSAAIADMERQAPLTDAAKAMLSSGVQAGFAIGAILYAVAGWADRYDPRKVFAVSAAFAALANALVLLAPIGSAGAIAARVLTGALMAGVYPVGVKIAVGWGQSDRGFLVGLLVGALTLGSAAPHLIAYLGGADWRIAVGGASLLALLGAGLALAIRLGPHHASAPAFDAAALRLAWRDERIRLAYAGYLGHMWELYVLWAWIGVALAASFSAQMAGEAALSSAKLAAFAVVAIGAVASIAAGKLADRIGKAETTILAMIGSGSAAVAAALAYGGPPWLLIAIALVWGAFVIADSAQFSALVADYAPPERAGALVTLQTALGFALTVVTVQLAPWLAGWIGWPGVFLTLALGPLAGTLAMLRLKRLTAQARNPVKPNG